MATKKQIADMIRERFADMADRGRVMGQALKVRADMAVARRRMRSTFAELGEAIYARMVAGEGGDLQEDRWTSFQERVDGLKAELRTQEARLHEIMHPEEGEKVAELEAAEENGGAQ